MTPPRRTSDTTAQPQTPMDDVSIARLVAAGDRLAFESLMRRYNRRLYRLARASLRDATEAKDALQDAYLSAYRSIGQYRGDSALSTWLSRIVLNECLGRRRRATRRQNVIPLVSWEANMEPAADVVELPEGPDLAFARAQMRSVLERKVSELPEVFRVVFMMRSVEELSVEETAQCLGIPEETVRSRHFRAKGILRESLAKDVDVAERDIFDFQGAHCDAIVAHVLGRLDATE
jgi:RNA polymerase sigma-70 factor (ECF subfamily)